MDQNNDWTPEQIKEQRKYFFEWFTDLLFQQNACVLRDILRNQKENLFQEWLKVRPLQEDQKDQNN